MHGAEQISARAWPGKWVNERVEQWLLRRVPAMDRVTLQRRNIFIVPSPQGLLFIATAIIIFVAAINYGLSLAYALAFLMISLFLLTILHSYYNLHGITVRGLGAEAVFAGEAAVFQVALECQSRRGHEALVLNFQGGDSVRTDLVQTSYQRLSLPVQVHQRGWFKAPRLIIHSCFPLGLWRTWARLDLAQTCLVYPRPVPCDFFLARATSASGESTSAAVGVEDFHGLRSYQPGDALRQIAWKNLARGQGLMVKQFVDGRDEQRILDWDMFTGVEVELRLSYLSYMILQLAGGDCDYGLQMPGVMIAPDRGDAHQRRLLEVLALWS
jgi:uncharacterized protein (DUF58 family)